MTYIILISLGILLIFFFLKPKGPKTISKDAYLVDVRTPQEFKNGSVPNAINIPLSEISSSIQKLSNKENIVVFCKSGMRSGRAKKILMQNGIEYVVNGGSVKNVINALK